MDATITVTDDQTDCVVIESLKDSIELEFDLNKDQSGDYLEPDYDLIAAMKVVLQYYMSLQDQIDFFERMERMQLVADNLLERK